MKNTPEHISRIHDKVEEIRLAQEEINLAPEKPKAMGYRNPYNRLEDAVVSIKAQAELRDDKKLDAIIKKMEALNKELYSHLNATYQW